MAITITEPEGKCMTFLVEGISKHQTPESHVRRIGEYAALAAAIAAAQKSVQDFLGTAYKPGMDAKALFALYQTQGEHPFIFRDDDNTINVPGFNHAHYAMTLATEICSSKT